MKLPHFLPDRDARQAHLALKQSVEILNNAQHCAVLWFGEILNRNLYRDLGYSSIYQYASEELGFSATRTGDFKRLAEKLAGLPAVSAKVRTGELGYTKAREIVKVADPANEKEWLDVADRQSRRQLEETVRRAKKEARQKPDQRQGALVPPVPPTTPPAATRTRIGFEMTPTQLARYESLLARIPHGSDKADLLLDMMEAYLDTEEVTPRGAKVPRHQIHVHECPSCRRSTVQTARGEMELDGPELEVARCDALVQEPGKRNRSAVPPRVRREVLARDRHRCRRKGCSHNRFLDIHHLVPRQEGGTNDPANLVTLCSSCHRLWHEKGGDLNGLLDDRLCPKEKIPCSRPPANI